MRVRLLLLLRFLLSEVNSELHQLVRKRYDQKPERELAQYPEGCSGFNWFQKGDNITGIGGADAFGFSIAFSSQGNIMATGAVEGLSGGDKTGYVQVFSMDSNAITTPIGTFFGSSNNEDYGSAVALSADGYTVAIGACKADPGGLTNAGIVEVYTYDVSSSTWAQLGSTIVGDQPKTFAGASVALSSDASILAVGETGYDVSGSELNRGRVLIYEYVANEWAQKGSAIVGVDDGDKEGSGLALSSDGLIVGVGTEYAAGGGNFRGRVRIYQYDSASDWVQLGSDIYGDANKDYAGSAMSLSADGSTVAVGANLNDGAGESSGQVKVFTYNVGLDTWELLGPVVYGGMAGSNLGTSVSLSADGLTFAAGMESTAPLVSKAVMYTYNSILESWEEVGQSTENTLGRAIGVKLSSDGQKLLVSESNEVDMTDGRIRMFAFVNCTFAPTLAPSVQPSLSRFPTDFPSVAPSSAPSFTPSSLPSLVPTSLPSVVPTMVPSVKPSFSSAPTLKPSVTPSTMAPTSAPTVVPSSTPSKSNMPSAYPTGLPTRESGDNLSWEITFIDAYHTLPEDSEVHLVKALYNVSSHPYDVYLFEEDCTSPSAAFPLSSEIIFSDGGYNTLEVTLQLNQSVADNSSVISLNQSGTDIDFCLLVDLYTDEAKSVRPTFLETIIHLNIFSGFQIIEIEVDRLGPVNKTIPDANYDDFIDSYLCDEDKNEIVDPAPLPQGSLIYICVASTSPTFTVDSIYELELSQDAVPPSTTGIYFDAIDEGEPNIGFVVTDCVPEKDLCFAKMQLIADFFENESPTPIIVSGAIMIQGTSSFDRFLRMTSENRYHSERRADEDSDVGNFQFSLEITSDNAAFGVTSQSSGTVFAIGFISLSTTLTIMLSWLHLHKF